MKESYSNKNKPSPELSRRSLMRGIGAGAIGAAGAAIAVFGIDSQIHHSPEISHPETSKVSTNHLQRDLPSIIKNVGEVIPIASDARPYVVVEEKLPGPGELPGSGTVIDVTLNVSANTASHYHTGQELTPQQTDELIDSQ
jgi:hypothetical protein